MSKNKDPAVLFYKNKLREVREKSGLTQRQTADAVGVLYTSYQRYEYGSVVPNVNIAIKIAKLFNVTVEYLFVC